MSFARLHKIVTYAVAALGLLSLYVGAALHPAFSAFAAVALVVSWRVEGEIVEDARYTRAWTLAVVLSLVVQMMRWVAGGGALDLFIEFAAILQISRLFNRRAARDYEYISILSLVHLVAGSVLSTELGYAFVFLGFVVVLPWMLALSHFRRAIEGNYPDSRQPDERAGTDVRRVLASRRIVTPKFLAGVAALGVPMFFLTALVFVLFPRVGMGFLTFGNQRQQNVTGFGSNVELGGFGTIREDASVVLRATLPKSIKRSAYRQMRFRGTSFDHYDGRRWSRTHTEETTLQPSDGQLPLLRSAIHSDIRVDVMLEPLDERVLFVPPGTVALQIPPRVVRARPRPHRLSIATGLDIRYLDTDDVGIGYSAWIDESTNSFDMGAVHDPLVDPARYTQVPHGHDRVVALANELVRGEQTPEGKARMLLRALRDSQKYAYTLVQPSVAPDEQPLDVFLFRAKKGHCEYFATALAIMLRGVGIPSRNVTGFLGGRYNSYGDYYALRQGDAHSWVEAWLPGRGWITLDPTPPARSLAGPPEQITSELALVADALRARWTRFIVSYDLEMQTALFMKVRDSLRRSNQGRSRVDVDRKAMRTGMKAVAIGLGIAAILYFAWRWRVRNGPFRFGRKPPAMLATELYRELESVLDRRGKPRPSFRTQEEHAAVLQDESFQGKDDVAWVTGRLMSARFGARELGTEEIREIRERIHQVARMKDTSQR